MKLTKNALAVSLLIVGIGLVMQVHAQDPLTNGLVAFYPFSGNANDASGSGNNGTVNGATLTTDRFGNTNKAYLFGGTSAYITAPLSSTVFSNDFTASVWFNAYDIANGWPTILNEAGNTAFLLGIVGQTSGGSGIGNLYAFATHASPYKDWELWVPPPTLNTFYQVVVTRAGTNVTMYLNAQLAATGQVLDPTVEPGNTLYIGRQETEDVPGGYVFHGVIDEVRIYNRALSSDEVAQLYTVETTPPPGFETNGLVAYYPFNGDANDASGNGNNGTAENVTFTQVSNRLAAAFTGALDSSVTVPNSPSLSMTNAVTVCLWFEVFGSLNGPQCILDKAWKQPMYHDWTYRSWSSWFSDFISFVGSTNGAPSGGPNDGVAIGPVDYNKWYHVVGVADGGHGLWQIYSNGIPVQMITNTPFTLSTGPYPLVIGAPVAQTDSAQKGFYGAIDDVRIYNRVLSASEVKELHLIEGPPHTSIAKAVRLDHEYLKIGTNYQLQVSYDLNAWTNFGSPFPATATTNSQYVDVQDWNTFWRLIAP